MQDDNGKILAYRSCFIADVQISGKTARLQDTGKNFFFLDLNDKAALVSFRQWFSQIFLKGVAQTPTVFQYEVVKDGEGATDIYVKKFLLHSTATAIIADEKEPATV